LPSQLSLSVSPNPFNSRSVVRFELPCRADLNLALYDFNGRLLVQLIDETKNPGQYNATLDASTISAGIYIAVLKTENEFVAQKIVIIK